jgi:nucleoside-diphosphate-sugar epimerase
MKNYNILLTGATGFIGKNILSSSLFHFHNFFCVVKDTSRIEFLRLLHPKIDFITPSEISYTSKYKEKIDIVLHLSAYGVNSIDNDIEEMISTNIIFSSKVFSYSKNSGCFLFINFGSAFEYGKHDSILPITEKTFPQPETLYASSKLSNHFILNTLSRNSNVKLVTFRPFSLYGPFEGKNRLLPTLLNAGFNSVHTKLTYGEQVRDYMFINDLIKILYKTIENHDLVKDEIINICTGKPVSLKNFILTTIKVNNFNSSIFHFGGIEYRKNESMSFIGSNKVLLSLFPDFEFTDLEEGLKLSSKLFKKTYQIF